MANLLANFSLRVVVIFGIFWLGPWSQAQTPAKKPPAPVNQAAPPVKKPPAPVGSIGATRGRVLIARTFGSTRQDIVAEKNLEVYEGDEFTSGKGSDVLLQLNGGHTVHIGPESFYRLTMHQFAKKNQATQSLTKLLYGKIRASVSKINPDKEKKNTFEVHTPNSVLGVRGTEFIATFDEATQTSQVFTTEGEVGVKSARFTAEDKLVESSNEAVVKKGEQTSITGSGSSETLPQLVSPEPTEPVLFENVENSFKEEEPDAKKKLLTIRDEEEKSEAISPWKKKRDVIELGLFVEGLNTAGLISGTGEYRNDVGGLTFSYYMREPLNSFGWGIRADLGATKLELYNPYIALDRQSLRGVMSRIGVLFFYEIWKGIHLTLSPAFAFAVPQKSGGFLIAGYQLLATTGYQYVFDSGWRVGGRAGLHGTGLGFVKHAKIDSTLGPNQKLRDFLNGYGIHVEVFGGLAF